MPNQVDSNALELKVKHFIEGIKAVQLVAPCTSKNGIHPIDQTDKSSWITFFEDNKHLFSIVKFVPASGAATRMFKHLLEHHDQIPSSETSDFIENISRFPFFDQLKETLGEKGYEIGELIQEKKWKLIFNMLLTPAGLNYGHQPKGMIPFHQYSKEQIRTAFEEHLQEASDYIKDSENRSKLHFTISPQHLNEVEQFLKIKTSAIQGETFEIQYSIQSPETDTPAVNHDNTLFKDEQGRLVHRPAGHGALIHNLGRLDEDLIYIKNIDNVTTLDQREISVAYKKVIGGMLIHLKKKVDELLDRMEDGDQGVSVEARAFIREWFAPEFESTEMDEISSILDRPIRVCGMVKNQGEPGGGPFWIIDGKGNVSKQIIEKSQVSTSDNGQSAILAQAEFFNPVDLVCCIKNRFGEKYHLENFIDYSTGFVSEKNYQGKPIKAIELPGLWNGSMAYWNTVFVEVPIETFHPVKTVNDLLRKGHRTTYSP